MAIVEINRETCTKCNACAIACGACLIVPRENDCPRFLPGADQVCLRCGHCVAICPTKSIVHRELPPEQGSPIVEENTVSLAQVSQLVKSRRSIREFQDKPVPRELIEGAIDTARYGPTGHNAQEVRWLVIDNKEELRKMTAIGVDWFRSMSGSNTPWASEMPGVLKMHQRGRNIFLRNAPAVVVTYAEEDNPFAATDCAIALSYFDLAARPAGLGCCWNGYFYISAQTFPPMVEAIGLPGGFMTYGALMVGYPRFSYPRIPPRKPARIVYRP